MPELTLDGRRIAYRAEGAGPLVVCLHCSSSHSGQWKPLMAELAGRFRVVAPDYHGYGRSDPLPEGGVWFHHDARIVPALMAAEGADAAHVVGHSLGGALGFFVARGMGARILSLTMIEPVLFALLDEAGDPLISDARYISGEIARNLGLGAPEAAARAFVDFWSGEGAWGALDDGTRDYVTATIGRVHADWAGIDPGAEGQARLADARALALPVLLMRGGQSRASARAITALIAERLPDRRLVEVPGAAHMGAVTDPQDFNPEIVAFLDEAARQTPTD